MPPNSSCELPLIELRPAGEVGVEALDPAVVERQHVVLGRLDQEQPLELVQLVGLLGGEVVGLGPVVRVVELPDVVVEGRQLGVGYPRRAVAGDRGPALVVDAAVARTSRSTASRAARPPRRRRRSRRMLTPSSGFCCTPLTNVGSGSPAASSTVGATSMTWWNWWRISPLRLDAVRPVDDRAVAGAAPVRGDLLGPLVRACPWRAPSRRRSGCRPSACRSRRCATP